MIESNDQKTHRNQARDHDLLIRIDERLSIVIKELSYLRTKVDELEAEVEGYSEGMYDRFITKEEFKPIRRIVYGVVGAILLWFMGLLFFAVQQGWLISGK